MANLMIRRGKMLRYDSAQLILPLHEDNGTSDEVNYSFSVRRKPHVATVYFSFFKTLFFAGRRGGSDGRFDRQPNRSEH